MYALHDDESTQGHRVLVLGHGHFAARPRQRKAVRTSIRRLLLAHASVLSYLTTVVQGGCFPKSAPKPYGIEEVLIQPSYF